jgi:hypothetical protein
VHGTGIIVHGIIVAVVVAATMNNTDYPLLPATYQFTVDGSMPNGHRFQDLFSAERASHYGVLYRARAGASRASEL